MGGWWGEGGEGGGRGGRGHTRQGHPGGVKVAGGKDVCWGGVGWGRCGVQAVIGLLPPTHSCKVTLLISGAPNPKTP